ncbi:hypothetical protein ACTXKO_10785 [Corynebacterium casei]|nr:hypothetical protein [Corynebacterium casei]
MTIYFKGLELIMRVLVVGASGTVGQATVKAFTDGRRCRFCLPKFLAWH